MPLNVVDNYSKHIGIIVSKFMNKYVVALTPEAIGDYMVPFHEQIKIRAAEAWHCKNMFGKINEEKFQVSLKEWLPSFKEEYFQVGKTLSLYTLNKDDLFQYGLVKSFPTSTYILTEGKFMDDYYNIKLGLSATRIPGLGLAKNFSGLVGEVADIPQVYPNRGLTKLKLNSGDTDIDIAVPAAIITNKGAELAIQLDFTNQKILKIYTGDIIFCME